uniref:Expressed conserved protein n=1 Tax=Panagrellus redivivus TaxID=6233 RepID=A0A7E4VCT4_PANRE
MSDVRSGTRSATQHCSGTLEEDMLNIALAVSREESAKEAELSKSDEIRLQIALEESKRYYKDDPIDAYDFDTASANPEQYPASVTKTTGTSDFRNDDDDFGKVTPVSTWSITSFIFDNPEELLAASKSNIFSPPVTYNHSRTGNANEIDLRYLLATQPTNDPWAPIPAFAESRVEYTSESVDPWNNVLVDTDDPWSAVFPEPMEKPADLDWFLPSASQLSLNVSSESNLATVESRKRRAPHDNFLGPATSLVDLDNLMSPSIPAIPGYNPFITPPFSSTNPFI